MNDYKIYYREIDGSVKVISDDFSWMAFGLTWIWAFMENNMKIGAVLIGMPIVLFFLCAIMPFILFISFEWHFWGVAISKWLSGLFPLSLAVRFCLGLNGNKISEKSLCRNGYAYMETIQATSQAMAMMEYMEKQQ